MFSPKIIDEQALARQIGKHLPTSTLMNESFQRALEHGFHACPKHTGQALERRQREIASMPFSVVCSDLIRVHNFVVDFLDQAQATRSRDGILELDHDNDYWWDLWQAFTSWRQILKHSQGPAIMFTIATVVFGSRVFGEHLLAAVKDDRFVNDVLNNVAGMFEPHLQN
jgi:hypothetical protein